MKHCTQRSYGKTRQCVEQWPWSVVRRNHEEERLEGAEDAGEPASRRRSQGPTGRLGRSRTVDAPRRKMPASRRRSQGPTGRLGRSLTVEASRRKMPASRRRSQGPTRRLGRSLTVDASRRKMPASRRHFLHWDRRRPACILRGRTTPLSDCASRPLSPWDRPAVSGAHSRLTPHVVRCRRAVGAPRGPPRRLGRTLTVDASRRKMPAGTPALPVCVAGMKNWQETGRVR